jgi:hypothetical protein
MRSLSKTGLSATTFLLIVGSISFVMAATPRQAEQPAEVPERESLRGLVGMEVLVEPLDIEIEQLGLQTLKLQSDVKQRLQKAGVKVLTEHERLATPTAAMLIVQVDALHDRISRYFYTTDLFLTQRVRLEGHVATEVFAVTWMKLGSLGMIADDNVKLLEEHVLRKVDQFIKDYLSVNPDRKVNDQRQKP